MQTETETIAPTAGQFTLWHRRKRPDGRKTDWLRVASAGKESALVELLTELPSGESIVTDGRHPDQLPRARR